MAAKLTPPQTRARDAQFVRQCSLTGLAERLPLSWPTPADTPASPKRRYRSDYRYLGWDDLLAPADWDELTDFDLLLRLINFDGLRPVLAQRLGWTSARGHVPFDPVSLFLLLGWQTTNGWNRSRTLQELRYPRNADYARRFGFSAGHWPTEGGLRYFLTTLGRHSDLDGQTVTLALPDHEPVEVAIQQLNHLIAQSVALIRAADLLSPEAWQQALVCPDGMLHEAASRLRCSSVQASCYQSTTPESPRPCPAQAKQKRGCDCDTAQCQQICRFAPAREPEARFVYYSGSNQHPDNPNQSTDPAHSPRGEAHYGYRSLPLQLADPARRFSLILLDDFRPANEREETPVAALLLQLSTFYPDLHLDTVAGDAGFGFDLVLSTVYQLGAKRVIDLRHHLTDGDKTNWLLRGYDHRGRPICPFGYAFTANGFDASRQRHKWCCQQACCHGVEPLIRLDTVVYPPPDCPFQTPDHPHGQVINVGQRFADGSIRLVRDIPVGTPAWNQLYHRARNAVEGRNSTMERWDLKRLSVFGTLRGKATIFLADVWNNLITLARLVREATQAARVA